MRQILSIAVYTCKKFFGKKSGFFPENFRNQEQMILNLLLNILIDYVYFFVVELTVFEKSFQRVRLGIGDDIFARFDDSAVIEEEDLVGEAFGLRNRVGDDKDGAIRLFLIVFYQVLGDFLGVHVHG